MEADAILGKVEAAEGGWSAMGTAQSLTVGDDERAFFYRSAYSFYSWVVTLLPSVWIPAANGPGLLPYRLATGFLTTLESRLSPHPTR